MTAGNPTLKNLEKALSAVKSNPQNLLSENAMKLALSLEHHSYRASLQYWADHNTASCIDAAGSRFWFLNSFVTQQGGPEKVRDFVCKELKVRQDSKDRMALDKKNKGLGEWLKRSVVYSEPSVLCDCGTKVSIGAHPLYAVGDSQFVSQPGLSAVAGSADCPKCKKQIVFGLYQLHFGKDLLHDRVLLQAIRDFGIEPSAAFQKEGINKYFSQVWRELTGNKGDYSFR